MKKPACNFDGTNFEGSANYSGLVASWTFNSGLSMWTWEYIGGHYGTRQGNASIQAGLFGNPMPYNNALLFPSGGTDNAVELRDTSAFIPAINPKGTMEVWMRVNQVLTANPVALISKGTTTETSSFYLGLTGSTGKLVFRMGSTTVTSEGPSIPMYSWFHTAVTWNDIGAGYEVKFFINGELNDSLYLNRNSMPANSEPIRIGKSVGFPTDETPRTTYFDELRFWDENLSKDVINKVMFASVDAIGSYFQNDLVVGWSFDGSMIPSGRFNRMRGTFDIGGSNSTKFSSYLNESGGSISELQLFPLNTVLKSNDGVNHAFPMGFYQTAPFDTIPVNNVNGLNSVINVGPSFPDNNVSDIELFLNATAPVLDDFEITLTAPNGVSRTVMNQEGGNDANIMTIFSDDADNGINSPGMVAPFATNVQSNQPFGNFNNSPARGNWTLNIKQIASDNPSGFSPAILNGWGIRLNGQTVTGIQTVTTELPMKYELSQNYPNPFNPSTSIKFSIPQSEIVSLKIYDIVGREVATLVNSKLSAGVFEYNFNASALSSGVYFYRLDAGSFTEIKKMLLIK